MRPYRSPAALCGLVASCLALAAPPVAAADPRTPPAPVQYPVYATPRTPAGQSAELVLLQDFDTHVYILNGTDPFGWAALSRMADRVQAGGYPNTTYGQFYDAARFEREIRVKHRAAPQARFVLIGFSAGALAARTTANRLTRDGIRVAMLGYIGGDFLTDDVYTRPAGVGRVVNVTGIGYLLTGRNLFYNGTEISGAVNVRLDETHFGLPTRPETFELMYAGLRGVSAGAP